MPRETGLIPGTLAMLVLRVLREGPLHGYAIAQRIHLISSGELDVEEGSLYPALQKLMIKGWVKARWTASETKRRIRVYDITASGLEQLDAEMAEFHRLAKATASVLRMA